MDVKDTVFRRKIMRKDKLLPYGFISEGDGFVYKKTLKDSGFIMSVRISTTDEITAEVIDPATEEPYTLHLSDGAAGSFVGGVKMEYENVLKDIAQQCFEPDVFQSDMAKKLIIYVRDTYGDELEYLWEKFPDNAVWRRSDNKKWYGVILTVSKQKLGIESDEIEEIIDLREEPEKLSALLENENFYPGWHMNKKHWYTIVLDGSVSFEEICQRIDKSYLLAQKR